MHGLHTITGQSGNILARRPFFVFWFMGQISRYVLCFFGISAVLPDAETERCRYGSAKTPSRSPSTCVKRWYLLSTSKFIDAVSVICILTLVISLTALWPCPGELNVKLW